MSEFYYVGSELDLFAAAANWKSYWSKSIKPYLSGDILEAGAGLGSNTEFLSAGTKGRWVCLEPDPAMANHLTEKLRAQGMDSRYESICGTLRSLNEKDRFDTILYIDVLEHIEDDAAELNEATQRLRPGGRVLVLSPAHMWLFTPFDAAIGHYRRYNKRSLRKASPPGLELETMFYLDACGIMASVANRLLLQQRMPTKKQIGVWDRWIIPASRALDPLLMRSVGKTIIGVWKKPAQS